MKYYLLCDEVLSDAPTPLHAHQSMQRPIGVFSFDMDYCLFNQSYCDDTDENKSVIAHNQNFLQTLKTKIKEDFLLSYTFLGSNRQSYARDYRNLPYSGRSCFPEIREISRYLGTIFDPFLLADIFEGVFNGDSYQKALQAAIEKREPNETDHKSWVDKNKVILIYAQIHKIANRHLHQEIQFHFYDDNPEILEKLRKFYQKNQDLIPHNLNLTLYQYAGDDIKHIVSIQGSGIIDKSYRLTIRNMLTQVNESMDQEEERKAAIITKPIASNALLSDLLASYSSNLGDVSDLSGGSYASSSSGFFDTSSFESDSAHQKTLLSIKRLEIDVAKYAKPEDWKNNRVSHSILATKRKRDENTKYYANFREERERARKRVAPYIKPLAKKGVDISDLLIRISK
jgi:hypothetical protein